MKTVRSKKLWQYLHETGALALGEEAIAVAKAEYRRQYKREWKQKNKSKPKRELRPEFTLQQHQALTLKARRNGYKPTGYLKELALATLDGKINVLPFKERLTEILQQIVVAGHLLHGLRSGGYMITVDELKEVDDLLKKSQAELTEYLFLP